MKFELDIKITKDMVKKFTTQLETMARKEVAVGVPETAPDVEGVSQAYIAAIHEFGYNEKTKKGHILRIPKRSFLGSTISENLDKYTNIMNNEINNLVGRSNTSLIPSLKKLAIVVQNDVLAKFNNNNWESLKHRDGHPLIKTGELRQSIRGIVRNK